MKFRNGYAPNASEMLVAVIAASDGIEQGAATRIMPSDLDRFAKSVAGHG